MHKFFSFVKQSCIYLSNSWERPVVQQAVPNHTLVPQLSPKRHFARSILSCLTFFRIVKKIEFKKITGVNSDKKMVLCATDFSGNLGILLRFSPS